MRSNDNLSKRRAITKQSPSKGYGGEFDALVDAFDSWFKMLEGVFNILEGLPDMLEGLFNMLEDLPDMLEACLICWKTCLLCWKAMFGLRLGIELTIKPVLECIFQNGARKFEVSARQVGSQWRKQQR